MNPTLLFWKCYFPKFLKQKESFENVFWFSQNSNFGQNNLMENCGLALNGT